MAVTGNSCFWLSDLKKYSHPEEKILKNRPIRNKNCLWRPCLLTDRDEISNLYRGPSIDASYQVSVHLTKRLRRRRFLKIASMCIV
jgi:hypothetical protein